MPEPEETRSPQREPTGLKKEVAENSWRRVLDTALTAVVVSLVLGFFATIWRASTSIDDKLADLNKKADESARSLRATTDVLTAELAKIQVQNLQTRLDELEKQLLAQHDEFKRLRDFVAGGPATAARQPPALQAPKKFDMPGSELFKRTQEEHQRINQAIQQRKD
jgi:hypothetical protein